jgi:MFS family permease
MEPAVVTRPVRALAGVPAWRWWVVGSFLARLPTTMVVIALVLAGKELGSYGLGAALAAVNMGAAGAGALWRGRSLDRRELRRGIVGELLLVAVSLAAVALLIHLRASLPLIFTAVLVSGVASSAVMAGYRAFLRDVVDGHLLQPAYALDAVLVEVGFVSGPALAGGLALLIGPVGVLWVMAGFALVAASVSAAMLPQRHPVVVEEGGVAAAPWRDRQILATYLVIFAMGIAVGLLEAGFAPLAELLGSVGGTAGICSAAYALGSAVGGLTFATRLASRSGHGRRALVLAVVLALLMLPVAVAPSIPVLLGVLFLGGLPFATANAAAASFMQARIHPSRVTEGFALTTTAILLGFGAGSGVASLALSLEASPRLLYVLAAAPPLLAAAAVAVWIGRDPTRAPAPPATPPAANPTRVPTSGS